MGLKGVCTLINKFAPDSVVKRELTFFSKSTIAIDTGILLYKFNYFPNSDLLLNFAKLCIKYLSYNIKPVFIFDGPPPKCKYVTLEKRFKNRQKIKESIATLLKQDNYDKKELFKLEKQLSYVSKEDRRKVHDFLKAAGFDVFVSPGEAETMCAFLQHENIVDYTYTDDSDAFALGCKNVLRNFNGGKFDQINMDAVLKSLKLTNEQFIDMCILCGCDYCPQIPRIGYANAYNLITEYKNIENVLEEINNTGSHIIPENFNYKEARDAFTNFSKFERVSLGKKMRTSRQINDFKLDKSIIYKLKYLIRKFNN